HATDWIDDRRDAVVRCSHQRQSFLDRADLRLPEMLVRSCADAEPCVIRDIEHPRRAFTGRNDLSRENDLIAYQGNKLWRAGSTVHTSTISRQKSSAHFC